MSLIDEIIIINHACYTLGHKVLLKRAVLEAWNDEDLMFILDDWQACFERLRRGENP